MYGLGSDGRESPARDLARMRVGGRWLMVAAPRPVSEQLLRLRTVESVRALAWRLQPDGRWRARVGIASEWPWGFMVSVAANVQRLVGALVGDVPEWFTQFAPARRLHAYGLHRNVHQTTPVDSNVARCRTKRARR